MIVKTILVHGCYGCGIKQFAGTELLTVVCPNLRPESYIEALDTAMSESVLVERYFDWADINDIIDTDPQWLSFSIFAEWSKREPWGEQFVRWLQS